MLTTQETEKSEESSGSDYDDYIMRKVNEVSVIFRPKSGADDRVLQVRNMNEVFIIDRAGRGEYHSLNNNHIKR